MYFVTGNQDKLKEYEAILGFKLDQIKLNLPEIQEVQVKSVVEHKALEAYEHAGGPVIVEDTGLYIKTWNGFPGALIKWMGDTMGFEAVSNLLGHDRSAYAETIVGYYDGKELKFFEGRVEGKIAEEVRGENGFGWDPIFIPKGHEKTFAEMSKKEKNIVSMRNLALEEFKKWLKVRVAE